MTSKVKVRQEVVELLEALARLSVAQSYRDTAKARFGSDAFEELGDSPELNLIIKVALFEISHEFIMLVVFKYDCDGF